MPSSLTRVLSRAWASSARLPVSVCGTVTGRLGRGFSGPTPQSVWLGRSFASWEVSEWRRADFPARPPTLPNAHPKPRGPRRVDVTPYRLSRRPVAPECQPAVHHLRLSASAKARLNLGGRTLPRKPQAFGVPDSHRDFRYSYRHDHFCFVQRSSRSAFNLEQNAPLPSPASIEQQRPSKPPPALRRAVATPLLLNRS